MSSGWAAFRKTWIKPEVYPLIGSMAAALGVCGVALANKISQPGMTFSKSARAAGIEAQLEGIDEVKPMWSSFKHYSASIFEKSHHIMDNKRQGSPHLSVPVLAEAAEDDEELEDTTVVEQKENEPTLVLMEDTQAVDAAVGEAVIAAHAAVNDTAEQTSKQSPPVHAVPEENLKEVAANLVAELNALEQPESVLPKIVPDAPKAQA